MFFLPLGFDDTKDTVKNILFLFFAGAFCLLFADFAFAEKQDAKTNHIFNVGTLKSIDSHTTLKAGDSAPDFILPSITGEKVALNQFFGKKNVVISFVPAAWTPVCSGQWPGYNIAEGIFKENDAILLGISTDNIPTLYAWTQDIGGVWFPVLSDFWPHGEVAKEYGVLRSNGVSERALFVIDKKGIIRYIDVHDINERPELDILVDELKKLK